MTNQAQAAKMIRTVLKEKFPTIKFSVKSEGFSGGDSVNVQYENGPPTEQVRKEIVQFQYGQFNSMEDIYEYSNKNLSIPQTKYLSVNRSISEANRLIVIDQIVKKYGMKEWSDMACRELFGEWANVKLWRVMQGMTFAS